MSGMVPFLEELVKVETTIQKWPNVGWFTLGYQTITPKQLIFCDYAQALFYEKTCTLDFKHWIQKFETSNQNLVGFLWIEMDSIEYLEIPI